MGIRGFRRDADRYATGMLQQTRRRTSIDMPVRQGLKMMCKPGENLIWKTAARMVSGRGKTL